MIKTIVQVKNSKKFIQNIKKKKIKTIFNISNISYIF